MLYTVLAVAGGVGFLWVFYQVVRSDWPDNYFALSDITSLEISKSLPRYAAFRLLPVFLACLFVAVLAEGWTESGVLAGLAVALIHGALTAGRGFRSALHRKTLNRASLLAAHLAVGASLLLTGFAAGLMAQWPPAQNLIPDSDAVVSELWTALFAALLGAFLVKRTMGREVSEGELLYQLLERLPGDLVEYASLEAVTNQVDPDLVIALMAAENVQRPAWIRSFERLAGRFKKTGTYGIMQVEAEKPLSDKESIRRAIEERLPRRLFRSDEYQVDYSALTEFVRSYNDDHDYVEMVEQLYEVSAI